MMRSLYSGVSGLKVHQTKMDVIGNNIANVNTVGFKSSSVTFSDIFYQTTQTASGPNATTGAGGQNAKQIGLGSTLGTISTNITTQGGSQRTDNPFDLMISGDGFFVVNNGAGNYFSKAGNFTTDSSGTLVNGSGYAVMGWQADADGNIIQDRVSALRIMAEENMTTPPAATTQSTIFGNINKEDASFDKTKDIDKYIPVTMSFYDALGAEYQATYHIREAAAHADGYAQYTMNLFNITCNGKVVENAAGTAAMEVEMNASGDAYAYGTIGGVTVPSTTIAFNNTQNIVYVREATGEILTGRPTDNNMTGIKEVAPGGLLNATTGTGAGAANAGTMTLGLATTLDDFFTASEDIAIDLTTMTNFGTTASSSTVDSEKGVDGIGAGKAVGNMSSIGIQTDGKIVAAYSNGDNRILGQIVVANFANAAGLEKVGDNLYASTLNSGDFNGIGEDITANGDKFTTGVLEMSNVDLSTEFTQMITTQRGFQANSRIITTSDTLLEELINLKR